MLKKFFTTVLVLSNFLIQSTAMAGGYQKYLNGDRNYILYDGHQGAGRYVVRNSLAVLADEYPMALIGIESVIVPNAYDGSIKISSRNKLCFAYDREARKIYSVNVQTRETKYLPPNVSRAMGEAAMKAAEIAYYLATSGKKFYGFPDSFYPDL